MSESAQTKSVKDVNRQGMSPSLVCFLHSRELGERPRRDKVIQGSENADVSALLGEEKAAVPTHNQGVELSGHPRATFLTAFSHNKRLVASTHGDHTVRVTCLSTGRCLHVLSGHPRTPWTLAFHPTCNDILASGCLDGQVRIWDLAGGGCEVWQSPDHLVIASLAFHPTQQLLAIATGNQLLLWDWSEPKPCITCLTSHDHNKIRWIRFDPLGRYLYTGISNNSVVHSWRAPPTAAEQPSPLSPSLIGHTWRPTASTSRHQSQMSPPYSHYHIDPRSPLPYPTPGRMNSSSSPLRASSSSSTSSDGPVAGPSGRRRQWLQRQYRSIVQELARRHEPVTGTSSDGNNLVRPAEAPSIAVPEIDAEPSLPDRPERPMSPAAADALQVARDYSAALTRQVTASLEQARTYAQRVTQQHQGPRIARLWNQQLATGAGTASQPDLAGVGALGLQGDAPSLSHTVTRPSVTNRILAVSTSSSSSPISSRLSRLVSAPSATLSHPRPLIGTSRPVIVVSSSTTSQAAADRPRFSTASERPTGQQPARLATTSARWLAQSVCSSMIAGMVPALACPRRPTVPHHIEFSESPQSPPPSERSQSQPDTELREFSEYSQVPSDPRLLPDYPDMHYDFDLDPVPERPPGGFQFHRARPASERGSDLTPSTSIGSLTGQNVNPSGYPRRPVRLPLPRRSAPSSSTGLQFPQPSHEQMTESSGEQTTEPSGEQTTEPFGGQTTEPFGGHTTEPSGEQMTEPSGEQTTEPSGEQTTEPSPAETDNEMLQDNNSTVARSASSNDELTIESSCLTIDTTGDSSQSTTAADGAASSATRNSAVNDLVPDSASDICLSSSSSSCTSTASSSEASSSSGSDNPVQSLTADTLTTSSILRATASDRSDDEIALTTHTTSRASVTEPPAARAEESLLNRDSGELYDPSEMLSDAPRPRESDLVDMDDLVEMGDSVLTRMSNANDAIAGLSADLSAVDESVHEEEEESIELTGDSSSAEVRRNLGWRMRQYSQHRTSQRIQQLRQRLNALRARHSTTNRARSSLASSDRPWRSRQDDLRSMHHMVNRMRSRSSHTATSRPLYALTRPTLHPHYAVSILDDTLNTDNVGLQAAINTAIAGAFVAQGENSVASNIMNQTYRIQYWDLNLGLPDLCDAEANIVVSECKLHNDATCDISDDGQQLAVFVPSHRGFPDDFILGVFSLAPDTLGDCLYTKSFGPNAISVSLSPLGNYVLVGLASKRLDFVFHARQLVGQVYKLVTKRAGEDSTQHVCDLLHPYGIGVPSHISVNSARWLPCAGQGLVYGTNQGHLHICRPGYEKPAKSTNTSSNSGESGVANGEEGGRLHRSLVHFLVHNVQHSGTQTVQRTRRTASTQTEENTDE